MKSIPKRRGTVLTMLAASSFALIGCGSATATHGATIRPPTVGVVTGVASPCTGLLPPAPGRVVTVVLRRLSQAIPTVLRQTVKGNFVYRFGVLPATYSVTSDQSYVPVRYVIVHLGKVAKADLHPGCSPPPPCSASSGFELSLATNQSGQSSPVTAAEWFSTHGGVPGIPRRGWHQASRTDQTAQVFSGHVILHVIKNIDGTWQVDSGMRCN